MTASNQLTTGLPGLDRVLKGLLPGDNIVWQVNSIDDYGKLVGPYCEGARGAGRKLIYFRFAKHDPLVSPDMGAEIHTLHPEEGFETFLVEIHRTIEAAGVGAFYVFDCLSDLAVDWYSDQMLGNFFRLTCPYLYDLETIAYFSLLRNYHSTAATAPIAETTQLLLDVCRHKGKIYVLPLKAQHRYSLTMHMLHVWEGDDFVPVAESATIAEVLASFPWSGLESENYGLNIWNRTFLEAQTVAEAERGSERRSEKAQDVLHRSLRMVVSRDDRLVQLAEKHLAIEDVLAIKKRMIGTGLIGGKSVGFLLARAILKRTDPRWADLLEMHDSFYIGSDVFYTFLVLNGCWWDRLQQKDPEHFLDGVERARQRILRGGFPGYIMQQFSDMLDYYGQSPIIVRSSSLLEDNYGNSFAGKYESLFFVNQGQRHRRIEDFISAVRTIYASTMSERALNYRALRGLLDRDEQMSLLVQRVSGAIYGHLFYPQLAGVGFSFNPYVWNEAIDPQAGVLRLVFGLGTRAVERSDDDYTRVVALNDPERRPESNFEEARQYTQRRVDVLDLEANRLVSMDVQDVMRQSAALPIRTFASPDEAMARHARERGRKAEPSWVLTFHELLTKTPFVRDMREMLRILQDAYEYPIDVEFTANFVGNGRYRINLVQCRPLQVKEGGAISDPPSDIDRDDLILEAHGAVIGHSRLERIDRFIYVSPAVYGQLPINERYEVARLIGQLTRLEDSGPAKTLMLLGPGRWGTTTPSLGVPVTFAEIDRVSILCEIVAMREDLVPDVSLGTHFFMEMVELDMLYLALFPTRQDNFLNSGFFERAPNQLARLLPGAESWSRVIHVVDAADVDGDRVPVLNANTLKQKVVCYMGAQ